MLQWSMQEVEENMKPNQFGGRKGMSTDHHLVLLWEQILKVLDTPGKQVSVLGMTSVNLSTVSTTTTAWPPWLSLEPQTKF